MMRFGFGIVVVVGLAAIVRPLLAAQRSHGQDVSTVESSMVQQQIQMGKAIYQSAMKLNTAANELTIAAEELTQSAIQAINVAIDKAHSIAMMQMTAATESHQQPESKLCWVVVGRILGGSTRACGTGGVCVVSEAIQEKHVCGGSSFEGPKFCYSMRYLGVCASDGLAAMCHKTTDEGERPKIAGSSVKKR
ncbi:unnamed protein product [Vitrella brassicaformis CCMP3155]|uniref:Uncharacterized protein n=1 Tax=Vitrella brassicaformis (strain CCMP3155) TaxID=1169540 RepID=A0A0G4EMV9_VITBC|nr:unnamed protein product [Vitrella brassicaformis CCMP3155]|eukprot:CEL98320.1 unnamed protein product [Vitrella brassicaformis CCMP3155]